MAILVTYYKHDFITVVPKKQIERPFGLHYTQYEIPSVCYKLGKILITLEINGIFLNQRLHTYLL